MMVRRPTCCFRSIARFDMRSSAWPRIEAYFLPLGVVMPLDVFSCVTPPRLTGQRGKLGYCPEDRGQVAAGERGEHDRFDGSVAAPAEVAAEVAEAQVVGGNRPPDVVIDGLARAAGMLVTRQPPHVRGEYRIDRPDPAELPASSFGSQSGDLERLRVPGLDPVIGATPITTPVPSASRAKKSGA
jgi:hypothetical protein